MIRAGSSYWDNGGFLKNVEKIIQHPKYAKVHQDSIANIPDYDFSLLKLKNALQYSTSIQPVRLPKQNEKISSGTNAIVSGWGLISEKSSYSPKTLHTANVKVIDNKICYNAYGDNLTVRMFCAGFTLGRIDTCQGEFDLRLMRMLGHQIICINLQ